MEVIIIDSLNSAGSKKQIERVQKQKEMQLHQGNAEALRNLESNMELI